MTIGRSYWKMFEIIEGYDCLGKVILFNKY